MVLYRKLEEIVEILKRYGFGPLSFGYKSLGQTEIYFSILGSSSFVLIRQNNKYFISLFPCDVFNGKNLEKRVLEASNEILKLFNLEKEFSIIVPYSLPPFKNKKFEFPGGTVGVACVSGTIPFIYYPITIADNEANLINPEKYKLILEKFGYYPISIVSFGRNYGYSAIFMKLEGKDIRIVTIHTWPEVGKAHIEYIVLNPSSETEIEIKFGEIKKPCSLQYMGYPQLERAL